MPSHVYPRVHPCKVDGCTTLITKRAFNGLGLCDVHKNRFVARRWFDGLPPERQHEQRRKTRAWHEKRKETESEDERRARLDAEYDRRTAKLRTHEGGRLFLEMRERPCTDCGREDLPPDVMQFDHVRGVKKFNLGLRNVLGRTSEDIKDECLKCEVRCPTCHTLRHWQERINGKTKAS